MGTNESGLKMEITIPTQNYLDTLLLYYEEEVEGEAYFQALAGRLKNADQKAKMVLIADVERYASASVEPLLAKHGLKPGNKEELFRSGQKHAHGSSLDWIEILERMTETFPNYIDMFKNLEAMAPVEDRPLLEILTAHEIAALEFLHKELKGDPSSTSPMMHYLKTGTAETCTNITEQT
jgi:dimethylamine/trimethylamine dehydrogenase